MPYAKLGVNKKKRFSPVKLIVLEDKDKFQLFQEWIELGEVFIQLDTRRDGVAVPEHCEGQHALTLRMSMAFNYVPYATEEKISCTLKFGQNYFDCEIPWPAIWAMSVDTGNPNSAKQQLWHQDMPREAAADVARQLFKQAGQNIKSKLGLVKDKSSEKPPEKKLEKSTSSKRKPPTLRRIK